MLSKIKIPFITLIGVFTLMLFCYQPVGAEGEPEEVKQKTEFYYTVKKGDTLWDISKHFFDSPWVWPELWSENKHVANPHLIYPGNRIRIYRENGVVMIEQAPPEENASAMSEPQPEETLLSESESMEQQPESEDVAEKVEYDGPVYVYSRIEWVGFVREKPIVPQGEIFKIKDNLTLVSQDNIIYIRQEKEVDTPDLIPGGLYTIYEPIEEPVVDDFTGEYVGIQHLLKGVVEITEILEKDPATIAEGKIVKSYRSIKEGDSLMSYKRRAPEINLSDKIEKLDGKILMSEERATVLAEDDIAFINKGSADGVKPGQEYIIYYQEKVGPIERNIDIGALIVLHTEEKTSTVLITSSERDIEPGWRFRSKSQ